MIAVHHEMMTLHNLRLVVCLRSTKRLGLKLSLPAVPFVAQAEEVGLFGGKKGEASEFGGARGIKKAEAEMKSENSTSFRTPYAELDIQASAMAVVRHVTCVCEWGCM